MVNDEANIWPVFLLLDAMYNKLLNLYLSKVCVKGFVTAIIDTSQEYFNAFLYIIRPCVFDMDIDRGCKYRVKYDKLRVTPSIFCKK